MKRIQYILSILAMGGLMTGCEKDDTSPEADIFYTVSIADKTVTFANETTGAVSYRWDFGDGESSTEESPVHTYPAKGKYVPTLYATTKDGKVTEGSTVIYIAKTSPVKLDDNTFDDWNNVTQYQLDPGAGETFFRKVKFDYDAQYIFVYLEVNSKQSNGDIYDFYLDTDNNATTGLLTDMTGGGYDVLLEGSIFGNWWDAFNHKGAQNAFSFEPSGATEFYSIGNVEESGGVLKYEVRLVRSKLKNMAATTAFKVGIIATKSDWSATLGRVPGPGQPSLQITFE
ncbi:PKD domain-containing protein [Chitinophaga sp. GCM10012297]|uniref:PKD domain-containing protein n=1 Tax=Chitinophaga chungangae TaxID=2821488 RepID=A0ABS3YF93_9BACT|nr:PKD domain-containing protein [Chitinophaga chungangae]MBO9153350.1 PKD domain-containing protein [Chitinophaga chungangae]